MIMRKKRGRTMFLNDWSNLEEMIADFWPGPGYGADDHLKDELDGVTILLASYGQWSYEGNAFVLFERGEKLYEVNGSHCSCYGLERQWEPEETTVADLRYRMTHGDLGQGRYTGHEFSAELDAVLDQYERRGA